MAKGKKKEELTIEEKLEQALVPREEWPYEVPENWCWVRLQCLCDDLKAGGDKPVVFIENANDKINGPGVSNGLINDGIVGYTDEKKISKGAITISGRGTIGKAFYREYDFYPIVRLIVIIPKRDVNGKYLKYVFDSLEEKGTGTSIPQLTVPMIRDKAIPLPPLAEQQRIVDRIESLFSKLDEAKEKAQEALDGFEERKAAILHRAFSGELTEKWREENGVSIADWNNKKITELCKSLKYGTAKKSLDKGKVVVIRMGNLQNGEIDWTNLAFTDDEEDIEKYQLKSGDVLFNRTNSAELVGKTSVYRGERPAIYAGYIIKLDYDRSIVNGEFLNYILNSPKAKEYCNSVKTDGVNQSNINAQKIGNFQMPVPTLDEQIECVRLLKKLLKNEKQVQGLAIGIISEIDDMKNSILAKAFRGELGTNDLKEDSVKDLLKTIL